MVNFDWFVGQIVSIVLSNLQKSSHPIVRCCSVVAVSHASLHAVDMGLSDMHTTKNKSYVKGGMLVGLLYMYSILFSVFSVRWFENLAT